MNSTVEEKRELANEVWNMTDQELRVERIRLFCEKYRIEDKGYEFGVQYTDELACIMSSQFGFDRSLLCKHVDENGDVIAYYLKGKKILKFKRSDYDLDSEERPSK